MLVDTAVTLVDMLIYKPGWSFRAESYEHRYEGTMRLFVDYEAQWTNRDDAPFYGRPNTNHAEYPIIVSDLPDDTALYRRVLEAFLDIEQHEAREYFRVAPTNWAPFHPHKVDGMRRWGTEATDIKFGV